MLEFPPNENAGSIEEETARLAHLLETTEDEEIIIEKLPQFFSNIEESLGTKITNDAASLYSIMTSEKCLARIESIAKVIEALEQDHAFNIGEGDTHYANAVIPEPEGIKLAFGEGQAMGPIRTVIGFGKTLVGFKSDNIEVQDVEFAEDDTRDLAKRGYLCRHVDGTLSKKDIRTVVMRIPTVFIKDENMMQGETRRQPFVFRGFEYSA